MRKALVAVGVVCLLVALVWPWLKRGNWLRHIGRSPGDIHIDREGFSFHFPIVTGILASVVITGLVWLVRRS